MALAMKDTCEKCRRALTIGGEAYICSYECTFCAECVQTLGELCPNCGGELVRRPRRRSE